MAELTHAMLLLADEAPAAGKSPVRRVAGRVAGRIARRIETRWHALDIHTDLAEEIGTARWYRGLGTMLGLGIAALSFWPDFSVLQAATALPAGKTMRDEFRSQMILPLAYGADSGRHMGATAAVVPVDGVPERPSVRMTAVLAQRDSFGRMLQRAGVGPDDAARAAAMIAGAVPLDTVEAGTRFDIVLGRRAAEGQPRPLDRLAFRARFDLDLAVERGAAGLVLARRAVAVDATPLRIQGTVGTSLYRSARAAGAPVRAIQQYLQAIDAHIGLDGDIAPTDRFDIVVAWKRSSGGQTEAGDLLYAGLDRQGRSRLQLMRWSDGRFYDAAGIGRPAEPAMTATGMVAPVAGRITSSYGMRMHPVLRYARMHAGVDFGAAWGAPIHAVNTGLVVYAGRHGGHGNYVRLQHGAGLATGYAHMSRIAVAPGMKVNAGQVIGYVGSTGLSTGPHLHYEVYRNGRTVNPLAVSVGFAMKAADVVDQRQVAAFKAKLARLKAVKPAVATKAW